MYGHQQRDHLEGQFNLETCADPLGSAQSTTNMLPVDHWTASRSQAYRWGQRLRSNSKQKYGKYGQSDRTLKRWHLHHQKGEILAMFWVWNHVRTLLACTIDARGTGCYSTPQVHQCEFSNEGRSNMWSALASQTDPVPTTVVSYNQEWVWCNMMAANSANFKKRSATVASFPKLPFWTGGCLERLKTVASIFGKPKRNQRQPGPPHREQASNIDLMACFCT